MKHEKFKAADLLSAMEENGIKEYVLAEELEIIFNDYFLCSGYADENKLTVTFLNGQEFEISINEKI